MIKEALYISEQHEIPLESAVLYLSFIDELEKNGSHVSEMEKEAIVQFVKGFANNLAAKVAPSVAYGAQHGGELGGALTTLGHLGGRVVKGATQSASNVFNKNIMVPVGPTRGISLAKPVPMRPGMDALPASAVRNLSPHQREAYEFFTRNSPISKAYGSVLGGTAKATSKADQYGAAAASMFS